MGGCSVSPILALAKTGLTAGSFSNVMEPAAGVPVPARALPLAAGDAAPIGVDDVGEAVAWLRREVHAS